MSSNKLRIDHSFEFKTLPNAPIVEAVLHWQVTPPANFQEPKLAAELRTSFPDYEIKSQHNLEAAFTGSPDGLEVKHKSSWEGVRLTKPFPQPNQNPSFVCQFQKHGVVVSRLAPYTGWNDFEPEALRFWQKYLELANPAEVSGLTTRFISLIPLQTVDEVSNYIEIVCQPMEKIGLSADQYYHQDLVQLSNHPYKINVIRAVQPGSSNDRPVDLIVDISVSTTNSFCEMELLEGKLKDLRFIKNQVFFTLMNNAEQNFGAKDDGNA